MHHICFIYCCQIISEVISGVNFRTRNFFPVAWLLSDWHFGRAFRDNFYLFASSTPRYVFADEDVSQVASSTDRAEFLHHGSKIRHQEARSLHIRGRPGLCHAEAKNIDGNSAPL